MLVGYMRVSTDGDRQTFDLQRDALLSAGVDERHLFEDRVSGSRSERRGLAKASMSVLRLIPKVRQTAALEAPPSSAEVTAASFSASIVVGRPPRRPRRRAAASPACLRSWMSERSNCASAPNT